MQLMDNNCDQRLWQSPTRRQHVDPFWQQSALSVDTLYVVMEAMRAHQKWIQQIVVPPGGRMQ